MKLTIFVLLALSVVMLANAYRLDFANDGDNSEILDQQEASEFFKRLFHPFSTKIEEIKRETREVYEEKCESVVPTQR
jgi:uncharacterized protein YfbU (UPF0304 family)